MKRFVYLPPCILVLSLMLAGSAGAGPSCEVPVIPGLNIGIVAPKPLLPQPGMW